ncbi:hypothetical protein NM688_g213 [Phlebia brevispora]|uniref:Uncharacterized protein n=1 Tax=Phlebia brevispora TaxID=194682 RepID=A0ACC1TFB6_9APHY|nr:hypothetical protein NM688_g213 [Phlebia brevispora]
MDPFRGFHALALVVVYAVTIAIAAPAPNPCDVNMRRTVDVVDGPGIDICRCVQRVPRPHSAVYQLIVFFTLEEDD